MFQDVVPAKIVKGERCCVGDRVRGNSFLVQKHANVFADVEGLTESSYSGRLCDVFAAVREKAMVGE